MSNQDPKIEDLQKKRARALEVQERTRMRNSYGPALASIVSTAIGHTIALDEFDPTLKSPMPFDWPRNLAEASGLVSAYIHRQEASRLLECFKYKLPAVVGKIGFHEKTYLGLAEVQELNPLALLQISEAAQDSVLFFVEDPEGVILVDCYPTQGVGPFSIVVQGNDLVRRLETCFDFAE